MSVFVLRDEPLDPGPRRRYVVAEGTQVFHAGVLYGGGQTLEATDDEADIWLRSGWVTEAKAKRAKKRAT